MKKLIALMFASTLALSLFGCSVSSEATAEPDMYYEDSVTEEYYGDADYAVEESFEGETADMANNAGSSVDEMERMVIKNAFVSLYTNTYDESYAAVKAKVGELGGEITGSDMWGSDENVDRYVSLTIRVPAERYDEFMTGVVNFGKVETVNESSEDVTTQYIDIQARITSLEEQEERLLELYDMATSVTEIMEIEAQLANVRYERESYTQQGLYLERQASMSTINLELHEEEQIIIRETGFFSSVAVSFFNGFDTLVDVLQGSVIGFVGFLPALILLAIIAAIIIAIIKISSRKRKQ